MPLIVRSCRQLQMTTCVTDCAQQDPANARQPVVDIYRSLPLPGPRLTVRVGVLVCRPGGVIAA